MKNCKMILLPGFLILFNFIDISLAYLRANCSDEVYRNLGIMRNNAVFCELIELKIVNRHEVIISKFAHPPMNLSLEETEGALINKNTPILSHYEFSERNASWCHLNGGIEKIGKFSMFHNYQHQAALVLFGNETDGIMEGIIGHDEIRYLPVRGQYVLIRPKYHSVTTFDEDSKINTSDGEMYHKILIFLDRSSTEGKTQIQTLISVVVFWNIVDMYYRQYFQQRRIQLNIAGIILPDKSSPHLNTTLDRKLSTILPFNMAVYLSGESAVIPTDTYDAIITMTRLPVCVSVTDYNQCPDKTYQAKAKAFFRTCHHTHENVKDLSGVFQYNSLTAPNDYIGTALNLKYGFLVDIDDCVENFTSDKHKNLRNYPRTLKNNFVSETISVCPNEASTTLLDKSTIDADDVMNSVTTTGFILPTTTIAPSYILRAGPPRS